MKRIVLTFVAILLSTTLFANDKQFDKLFKDGTLRIDYTFMGNAHEQHVALRDMSYTDNWYGRRINLDNVPLKGNGDLTLTD
ncbi:MAG: peptidase M64, partial [Alistipes sp.]|nr:peptidase M64 [Alistipes sp.]